jgi:hypothetical protein
VLTLEATRQVADPEPVRRSLPIRVLP